MGASLCFSRIGKGLIKTGVMGLAAAVWVTVGVIGCGSGGYPGGGISSLSASSVTLDATQSFSVSAHVTGNLPVTWSLGGSDCSPSACGTLSSTAGTSVTYTAPAIVEASMKLVLTGAVAGTKNAQTVAITVNPAPTLNGATPDGTVGAAYTSTLKASGGTAPLTMALTNGALPPGLKFDASTGVISGTPTAVGTYAFTIQVTDSATTPFVLSTPEIINITTGVPAIPPMQLTASTLPNGMVGVPYTGAVGVTGGVAPYSCTVTSGTLPDGLSMVAGCIVTGTPTKAGTATVTVMAKDSSDPALSVTGPQAITITPAALHLASGTLPNGTVNVPYTAAIGLTGGTAPYSCSVASGSLPAGLAMGANCVVSGTPTKAGTTTVTVKATDSSNPALSTVGPQTITIAAAPVSLTISSLPNGTVGDPYSGTVTTTGGTAPYTCAISGLPAGLTATDCVVSGTPTTAGSSTVTVKVTDSSNPTVTQSQTETVTILPAALDLTMTKLPDGTVNVPYSATIGITGGTTPYACSVTTGTLPAGLTMGANCTVSGTPTTAGSSTVTVKVTDASNPQETTSGPETITINPPPTLTLNTLPNGTVGTAYNATIAPTGGTSPYTCTISGLPAGLTANNCVVSGTPSTAGSSTVTVKATDSSSPTPITTTATDTVVIAPPGALSLTGSLPNATQGKAYSESITATGGTGPYTYSITKGSLPAGISMNTDSSVNPASALFTGTPTTVGASSFTLTVADSKGATASLPLVLMVDYPAGPNDSELKGPYAYLFQGYDDGLIGVVTFQTATVGSFTADGVGGISAGELDSNHQTTTSTTTTAPTSKFLGTYYVGADNRGMITITLLNTDGTTGASTTYAISLSAPQSPSTISTRGDLIQFDDNQLAGTRGSGTLLAQTESDITAGLKGSYAFGFIGDTPCLVSCALNLGVGPVASVGQFTTSGNTLTGMTDTAVAATYTPYQSAELSGSFGTPDENGRVQLTLDNASDPNGQYPTDYAAYIVNKDEIFVMSTDLHSNYILQAGTAKLQTTPGAFANSSMNGPVIGYENAMPNPGLVGGTLKGLANIDSATIFRADCDGANTCDFTNVDNSGLTSLVDSLTGPVLGLTKVQLLQVLLGAYTSTGKASLEPISTDGRGVLAYPTPPSGLLGGLLGGLLNGVLGSILPGGTPAPRVFYLVGPNEGYFLETGYAALGEFKPQTGAPFSLSTLNGTYVDGTIPAATVASINASGYFTADGAGHVTDQTLDQNVGVGTLNVLQLGTIGGATTYSLNDPNNNPATTGRYLLGDGSTVLYAISPGQFVLLNTSDLQTAPSVSFLYK